MKINNCYTQIINLYGDKLMSKKVMVTGLGLVTPIGNQVDKTWINLINGKSDQECFLISKTLLKS